MSSCLESPAWFSSPLLRCWTFRSAGMALCDLSPWQRLAYPVTCNVAAVAVSGCLLTCPVSPSWWSSVTPCWKPEEHTARAAGASSRAWRSWACSSPGTVWLGWDSGKGRFTDLTDTMVGVDLEKRQGADTEGMWMCLDSPGRLGMVFMFHQPSLDLLRTVWISSPTSCQSSWRPSRWEMLSSCHLYPPICVLAALSFLSPTALTQCDRSLPSSLPAPTPLSVPDVAFPPVPSKLVWHDGNSSIKC